MGVMANFEKIVKITDAFLDCIPIVSSISNAAQTMYKLAHRVDALSPVAPGLKTSIKIHVLSKRNLDCLIGSIPVIGNFLKLLEFIRRAISGFDCDQFGCSDDDLIRAATQNNEEIVHLSLGNNALNDPLRADTVLRQSADRSNNVVFRQILEHQSDWSGKSLANALAGCWSARDNNVANADTILNYLQIYQKTLDGLDENRLIGLASALENFLEKNKVDLAERVIKVLPEGIPFLYIQPILLKYISGVMTRESVDALIAKSNKPSLEELEGYHASVAYECARNKPSRNCRKTHFEVLNRLLDLAQLQPNEIGKFISSASRSGEFCFIEPLITKYRTTQLTLQSKAEILRNLLFSGHKGMGPLERIHLFILWIDPWKEAVRPQAHELYNLAPPDDPGSPFNFRSALLANFPGCDLAPQAE